jgi:hypothetical protein
MEQQWYDTDKRKPKESEKSLSQCHFVLHKSHMNSHGTNPRLHGKKTATNRLSYGTALGYY